MKIERNVQYNELVKTSALALPEGLNVLFTLAHKLASIDKQ